jgi:phosphohistidine phosphatase
MDILVVRHAIAEDRMRFARRNPDDDQRPLTKKGIERMREGARGLRALVQAVGLLAHSPLVRARQTAEILHKSYAPSPLLEVPELAPGHGPDAVTRWLATEESDVVCLVGHEPDLSELVAWLVCGRTEGFVDFKKGGACLVACEGNPGQGRCHLRWLATPRQLRLLGQR